MMCDELYLKAFIKQRCIFLNRFVIFKNTKTTQLFNKINSSEYLPKYTPLDYRAPVHPIMPYSLISIAPINWIPRQTTVVPMIQILQL